MICHAPLRLAARLAVLAATGVAALPVPAMALAPDRPLRSLVRDSFRDRDGLPQNAIRAMLHSASGLLWIGTDEGLAWYDGATFNQVGRREDPGLPSDIVTSLAETPDGTLWVGTTGGGLARRKAGRFEPVRIPGTTPDLNVRGLATDRAGGLWVATMVGAFHLEGEKVQAFTMAVGLPDDRVKCIAVDLDGVTWIGTRGGLVRVVGGRVQPGPAELQGLMIYALLADPAGGLWVAASSGGVAHLDPGGKVRRIDAAGGLPDGVTSLQLDRDGSLWIGTQEAGLVRSRGQRLERLRAADGLAGDWIYSLLEDREGSLWVGTQDAGLVRLREADFQTLGMAEGLSSEAVEAILQARNGDLWVATDGGVDLLQGGVLPARRVVPCQPMSLLQDRSGVIWIGTTSQGLWRWRDGAVTRISRGLGLETWIRDIVEDQEGTIWVGTTEGLFRMRGDRLERVDEGLPVERPAVGALVLSAKGELFVATEGAGVFRRGGSRFVPEEDGPPRSWLVSGFLSDGDGTVWMATFGGGLWRRRNGAYAHLTTAQGLPADTLFTILDDRLGALWLASSRGIFRAVRADLDAALDGRAPRLATRAWSLDDGLRSQEAAGGSHPGGWRAADGRLWFAMLRGASVVDPARLRPVAPPPDTIVRRSSLDGQPLSPGAPVTLPPEGGRLEIEFGARVLLGQRGAAFRYRLDGLEEAWSEPRHDRIAQYPSLPPGAYRFIVQARLGEGAWGPPATVEVLRQPPAWRTPLALAGEALGLLAVAAGLYALGFKRGARTAPTPRRG